MTFVGTRFYVMEERCEQCLYGPHKVVPNDRRKDILNGLKEADGFFKCHKGTIIGRSVACRGDWDQRHCGLAGQVAAHFGVVTFINEADIHILPEEMT